MAERPDIEREVKLASKRPLDLDRLGGEPLEHRSFLSTYHDTPDRLLARCGITLRRRLEQGRNDWQLKLPSNGARREVEAPGAPSGPPAAITDLLPAFLHGGELVPLATLRTLRDGVLVRTETGSAEVVVDDVAVLDSQRVYEDLRRGRDRADRRRPRCASEHRARRNAARSAPDRRPDEDRAGARHSRPPSKRPKTDAERIRLYVAQCYVDLLTADPGVRLGVDTEPVHDLRVAVRRLRALLRAARPMLAREWAEPLRDELGWLGGALGPLRDLDVFAEHLREEAAALGADRRGQPERGVRRARGRPRRGTC